MDKKNFMSDREKQLFDMAEEFEQAQIEGKQNCYFDADDWADLADWYATENKKTLAYAAAETGLLQHPDNAAIQVQLAYLYLDDDWIKKAEKVAYAIDEENLAEVIILKATIALRLGKDWETADLLEQLDEKYTLENIVEVVYMYMDAGQPEQALPWLEVGEKKFMEDEAFKAVMADYCVMTGQNQKAIEFLNQLIDKNPYSAFYWVHLARCYMDEQQFDKAIEAAEFAIVSDEEMGEAYLILSTAYAMLGNEVRSMEYLEKARKYAGLPEEFNPIFEGIKLANNGEWEKALLLFSGALMLEDSSTEEGKAHTNLIYAQMAQCENKLGHKKSAYNFCKKGIKTDPNHPSAYITLGCLKIEDGLYAEGVQQWNKAISLTSDLNFWYEIGSYAMDYGILDVAQTCFEKIYEKKPDFPMLTEQLTMMYLMQNNAEKFVEFNRRCQNPLDLEQLKRSMEAMMDSGDNKLVNAIKNILEILNQNKTS